MSISCSQNNVSGCSPKNFIDLIDTKIKEFNKMLDGEGLTTATYAQGPLNDRIIKFQELFGGNQTSFDSETCFSLLSFIYIFLHGDEHKRVKDLLNKTLSDKVFNFVSGTDANEPWIGLIPIIKNFTEDYDKQLSVKDTIAANSNKEKVKKKSKIKKRLKSSINMDNYPENITFKACARSQNKLEIAEMEYYTTELETQEAEEKYKSNNNPGNKEAFIKKKQELAAARRKRQKAEASSSDMVIEEDLVIPRSEIELSSYIYIAVQDKDWLLSLIDTRQDYLIDKLTLYGKLLKSKYDKLIEIGESGITDTGKESEDISMVINSTELIYNKFIPQIINTFRDLIEMKTDSGKDKFEKYRKQIDKVIRKIKSIGKYPTRLNLQSTLFKIIDSFWDNPKTFSSSFHNIMLTGGAGYGKTFAVRQFAEVFKIFGILLSDKVTEIVSGDLKASYVGQSGPKTRKALAKNFEGVIFLDEAYTLNSACKSSQSDQFGQEAASEILIFLNDYKGLNIFCAAGYKQPMEECFFGLNEGFRRRFGHQIDLRPHSYIELYVIIIQSLVKNRWNVIKGANRPELKIFEMDILENTPADFDHNNDAYGDDWDDKEKFWQSTMNKFMQIKNDIIHVNSQYYLMYLLKFICTNSLGAPSIDTKDIFINQISTAAAFADELGTTDKITSKKILETLFRFNMESSIKSYFNSNREEITKKFNQYFIKERNKSKDFLYKNLSTEVSGLGSYRDEDFITKNTGLVPEMLIERQGWDVVHLGYSSGQSNYTYPDNSNPIKLDDSTAYMLSYPIYKNVHTEEIINHFPLYQASTDKGKSLDLMYYGFPFYNAWDDYIYVPILTTSLSIQNIYNEIRND